MAASLSLKSLVVAVAAIGLTGITPPGGGARVATLPPVRPAAAVGQADPLTVQRAPDGLFYVTAAVNGVPVRFVVDTGANVVVLTRADAAATGVTGSASHGRSLRTAGGDTPMRWATIDRMTIGDLSVTRADAAIIGGDGPPHSLLGQSVLSRLGSVTLRGNRLELR